MSSTKATHRVVLALRAANGYHDSSYMECIGDPEITANEKTPVLRIAMTRENGTKATWLVPLDALRSVCCEEIAAEEGT